MHPHINFHVVHRQSQAWLRAIGRMETSETRTYLARWQDAVLEAVASVQCTSVDTLPRLFCVFCRGLSRVRAIAAPPALESRGPLRRRT